MTLPPPPEWTVDALCAEVGGDLWFPEPSDNVSARQAKSVCRRCPVTSECLSLALANGERFGIFGGLSPRQRQRLASRERRAA